MIQFITGLIVTTSIVIVIYLIGRIVAKHILQEPNPEDIPLMGIFAILVMGMLASVCTLVYWVGASVLSQIG